MAGALLAEWGADVAKVEHPGNGDPYRGLVTAGLHPCTTASTSFFQAANRGKRSGRHRPRHARRPGPLLGRLLAGPTCSRPTSARPPVAASASTWSDVRADNPSIVYVRGTAFGAGSGRRPGRLRRRRATGPARHAAPVHAPAAPWPAPTRPAFGDVAAALGLAGAITGLYRRAVTGEATVVDSSLLAAGVWQVQNDVVSARLGGRHPRPPARSVATWNPLIDPYRTADGRFIALMVLAPDRHWADPCAR